MRAGIIVVFALLALFGCGPKIEGLEAGVKSTVTQVASGDTLTLSDGLSVRLAGLDAPGGDEPMAKDARAALERLTLHRKVTLAYGGVKRGRNEQAFAHVFAQSEGGRWIYVQQALLLEGWARARTHRENYARASLLYAAEESARKDKKGLWAHKAYEVKTPETLAQSDAEALAAHPECSAGTAPPAPAPQKAATNVAAKDAPTAAPKGQPKASRPRGPLDFTILEGRVVNVNVRDRDAYINFGADFSRDPAIRIADEALAAWPGGAEALKSLENQRIRVRGLSPSCRKPILRVDHAAQIETLDLD